MMVKRSFINGSQKVVLKYINMGTERKLHLFVKDEAAGKLTLLFIIPRIVLLSSIQPEAETLDFSTHALPRNLLKMFPPHEHKQRQHCQAIW